MKQIMIVLQVNDAYEATADRAFHCRPDEGRRNSIGGHRGVADVVSARADRAEEGRM
jgi:hypothetical protein